MVEYSDKILESDTTAAAVPGEHFHHKNGLVCSKTHSLKRGLTVLSFLIPTHTMHPMHAENLDVCHRYSHLHDKGVSVLKIFHSLRHHRIPAVFQMEARVMESFGSERFRYKGRGQKQINLSNCPKKISEVVIQTLQQVISFRLSKSRCNAIFRSSGFNCGNLK